MGVGGKVAVQYIRILNPWFLELDNNGRPAAGYLVWTLAAGTVDTLVTTYKDRLLTSPNTNPVELDSRGEAAIFTDVDLKLVFTAPGGDLSSPIWTQDYVSEQLAKINTIGVATGTVNNHYVVNTVPVYASIPDGFGLVMIPDVKSTKTVGAKSFTGTGIDDLVFSGGYLGSASGQFEVVAQACYVYAPGAATAALSAVNGATPPSAGVHTVKITFVTAEGETDLGIVSASVTADGVKKIDLSSIPVGAAGKGVTSRKIYMTKAGGAVYYYVDEIADNVTTTYAIDTPDASLTVAAPAANTTGSGSGADLVKWRQDAGAWHLSVAITQGIAQHMLQGVDFTFAEETGHIIGDQWVVPVVPPAQLNFCALGSELIYKSSGGVLVVLDENDIQQLIPASLVWSASNSCWILVSPSLPILQALQPAFVIKEITGNAAVTSADARKFLNCSNGPTLTVATLSTMVGVDFWVATKDGQVVTVQVSGGTDLIMGPFGAAGVTSVVVGEGWDRIRFASNGAYLTVVEAISSKGGIALFTATDDWVCPWGVTKVRATVGAGGGSGGRGGAPSGFISGAGPGGLKIQWLTVVPGTTYTMTVGAGAGIPADENDGIDGGDSSFGVLLVVPGGEKGRIGLASAAGGLPGDGTGFQGESNVAVAVTVALGGKNYPAQMFGDYCTGGDGGLNGSPTNCTAGKPGFIWIEY